MTFINNTFDTVDDEELAAALALKSDKNETYTKSQVNNNFQPTGDYATNTAVALKADQTDVALKADQSDVALKADQSDVDSAMALKADQSSVALKADQSSVDTAMALKADQNDVDTAMALKADQSSVDTAMALKADQSDVALKADQTDVDTAMALKADQSSVDTAMALKADQSDVALKADQTDVDTAMALKADQSSVDTAMALKADQSDVDTSLNLKQDKPSDPADSFALVSDIPALSGGYTTSQIDGFLADKAEVDDVYTKTQSDSNYLGSVTIGSVSTLPPYDTNTGLPHQASVVNVGTGNEVILDFAIPQGVNGIPGANGANGSNGADGDDGADGADGSDGAAGVVSAVALAAAVASGITSMNLPTASDFTDLGTDITNLTDDKVSKPSDWSAMNNPTGNVPETELNPYSLDSYVYNKVRRQNKLDKETFLDLGKVGDNTQVNINSKHVKITSDGVNIGTNATPDTGYKFQVEGDIKMKNGTNKYLDMSTGRVGVRGDADHLLDGCDIKLYGDTCVTGDLMVSGTLTNGSGASYATTNDIAGFATTSSVSTLSTSLSTLQTSVGTNSSALASKADTSSIYTQQHINDNFQTVAPSGKSYAFDTDLVNFITASDITGKQDVAPSGETYAYVSQLPDTSSFITASTSALTNYDTSSTVDTKIANSSGSTDLSNYYTISQTTSAITNHQPQHQSYYSSYGSGRYVLGGGTNSTFGGMRHAFSGGNQMEFWTQSGPSDKMAFKPNNTERMTIKANGRVGINDSSPSYNLDVNGNFRAYGVSNHSDDRIKYNEADVSNALTLISQLNPKKYEKIMERPNTAEGTWIPTDDEWDSVKENYKHGDEFGFIAQDIRKIPELSFLVNGEETRTDTKNVSMLEYSNLTTAEQQTYTQTLDGYTKQIETQTPLALNYQGLFVLAIGAIQELKAMNDALEARISALENN